MSCYVNIPFTVIHSVSTVSQNISTINKRSRSRSSSVGPEGRFSFFHPKVKVKKTISLTSFIFLGLVGLKVLIDFKSFQGLLTNVVFYPDST